MIIRRERANGPYWDGYALPRGWGCKNLEGGCGLRQLCPLIPVAARASER